MENVYQLRRVSDIVVYHTNAGVTITASLSYVIQGEERVRERENHLKSQEAANDEENQLYVAKSLLGIAEGFAKDK